MRINTLGWVFTLGKSGWGPYQRARYIGLSPTPPRPKIGAREGGGQSLAAQTEAIDVLCVIISSQVGPALPTLEYSMLHWYKRDIQMT